MLIPHSALQLLSIPPLSRAIFRPASWVSWVCSFQEHMQRLWECLPWHQDMELCFLHLLLEFCPMIFLRLLSLLKVRLCQGGQLLPGSQNFHQGIPSL